VDVTSRHDEPTQPSLEALEERRTAATKLLVELGAALHWAALPASIVEARVRAVARAFGLHADIFVLQGFLCVESEGATVERVELRRIDFDTHWNIGRTHELYDLCTSLVRGERGVFAGRAELERILAEPRIYGKGLVALAYSVYGLAVAARIGGGRLEALAGAIISSRASWPRSSAPSSPSRCGPCCRPSTSGARSSAASRCSSPRWS